ncbi:MAG: glycosyltransferase family 32 protein [Pseudorhodobacter sp.]
MTKDKQTLDAALLAAAALRDAGELAEAGAALDRLAASDLGRIAPVTALGINRRLHAALLRQAKARDDRIARVGLQAHLVPPPERLAAVVATGAPGRAELVSAAMAPVPHLLHQIWIGPRTLPVTLAAWAHHAKARGYRHRLWREADLAAVGFDRDPVFAARLAAGDYPGAVDAARYAILAAEGGIYLDADWYPARMDLGFHDFLPMRGLCLMAEEVPRLTGRGALLLANSVIGTPPGHPVLHHLCDVLPRAAAALPGAPAWWVTGPLILTLLARRGPLTLMDEAMVAGHLPPGSDPAAAQAMADQAAAADQGLLIGWKPWEGAMD